MYNGVMISIIGYKNHSIRLQNILSKMGVDTHLWNHNTDNFSDIINSDAIVIASPNDTHINYIKKILNETSAYVFCEKPPVTNLKDLEYLNNLSDDKKERIFFNFNYRFSDLPQMIKKYKHIIGKPVHFNFISSHGLALKDSFENNWRFTTDDDLMGVYGTVAVHYIDLCLWLLGECIETNIHKSNFSNSKTADSISIDMKFKNGCTVNIFVSYVTPFINKSDLIFDNAIFELDNGKLNLYEPRESFDDVGNFVKPHGKCISNFDKSKHYYDNSIEETLSFFVNNVKNKNKFSIDDFQISMETNKILINNLRRIND
tara:strand:+ start:1363 stop:2310 length:948 start_codon:yes stop_codon:yes gene_type:complete